jgi:hypothetical protein
MVIILKTEDTNVSDINPGYVKLNNITSFNHLTFLRKLS